MLYRIEGGFLFVGSGRIDVPWSKVVSVERKGDTRLLMQRRDHQAGEQQPLQGACHGHHRWWFVQGVLAVPDFLYPFSVW